MGLAHLLGGDPLLGNQAPSLNQRPLPHRRRAKSVIQLFMLGGASQCDTFDYKPELIRRHGEKVNFTVTGGTAASPGPVLKSPWDWKQHGESGRWVTSALPNMARHVDKMAFLMGMHAPTSEHSAGQTMQTSGFVMQGFPTVGAWVSYALGSLNENLPRYVALPDPVGLPWTGKAAWTNGFLPALHQGTMLNPSAVNPVPDLFPPKGSAFVDPGAERDSLDLINTLNRRQFATASDDSRLEARIASYELAARMQTAVPDLLDLAGESAIVKRLYGIGDPVTEPIGRNCLIARRLVERGVRFVQVWVGSGLNGGAGNWDNHGDIRPGSDFERMCRRSDKPIAGLLEDLHQRGLLDETIVYWTSEFGRTPYSQGSSGRDHNGNTFVSWLAGGGIKGGATYGQSDEFSYAAAENATMCYEQHATILHLLGLNHRNLSFRHSGIDRRLTDVHGRVIPEIIA
ncbi:MAG TPA: DUF1501 domain-containing protein [Tepidisphaeraceae bacterium]|jgi:hypothetical protein|nr:DUF1501 domain-containing protein [Tepidisphaeraceae bacterium]